MQPLVRPCVALFALAALCLPLLRPAAALGDEADDTVEVVASGTGTDEASALKRAYVNAVRQAVGMVVDAETVVSNDEVIKDRVLSASNAIVTRYEPIGKPERDGDLTTVQIKATVKRGEVRRRLEEANVVSVEVDGAAAFAKAASALQNDADAVEVVQAAFDGFPGNVLKATPLGDPVVIGQEGGLNQVVVGIRVEVDQERYTSWRTSYAPLFARISQRTTDWRYDPYAVGRSLAADAERGSPGFGPERHPFIPENAWATSFNNHEIFPDNVDKAGVLAVVERIGNSKVVAYRLPDAAILATVSAGLKRTRLEVSLLDGDRGEVTGGEALAEYQSTGVPVETYVGTAFAHGSGDLVYSHYSNGNLVNVAVGGMVVWPYTTGASFRPSAFVIPMIFRMSDADLARVKSVQTKVSNRPSTDN